MQGHETNHLDDFSPVDNYDSHTREYFCIVYEQGQKGSGIYLPKLHFRKQLNQCPYSISSRFV